MSIYLSFSRNCGVHKGRDAVGILCSRIHILLNDDAPHQSAAGEARIIGHENDGRGASSCDGGVVWVEDAARAQERGGRGLVEAASRVFRACAKLRHSSHRLNSGRAVSTFTCAGHAGAICFHDGGHWAERVQPG